MKINEGSQLVVAIDQIIVVQAAAGDVRGEVLEADEFALLLKQLVVPGVSGGMLYYMESG